MREAVYQRYVGKVAVITGGAVGLGRAFATAMAAEGAAVAVLDLDHAGAELVAEQIIGNGGAALGLRCDVADDVAVERAMAQVSDVLGGLDVLVNNAGKHLSTYNRPFCDLPRAEVRALFEVNVIGTINCSVAFRTLRPDRPDAAAILNIASVAAHSVTTPYGVSKLAVRGLTTAFAKEFAAAGIRVNAVSPGLVDTESAMADLPASLLEDYIANRQLIGRQGRVSDVVSAALFLCSAEAEFITGETLKVSAGYPLEF
jgi:NAD(P)-dependent dehydrogenase (short-subunit alcohol dehydrogenase family)